MNDLGSTPYGVTLPVENGFINISNGNLHLEFPLASHPQRGALSVNERLVYDSRIWMFLPFGSRGSYHWWPQNVNPAGGTDSSGGWRFVKGNEVGTISYTLLNSNPGTCYNYNEDNELNTENDTSQVIWTDPNGTAHPFSATSNYTYDPCAGVSSQSISSGTATDGSGYSATDDGSGNPLVRDNNGTEVYPAVIDRYGNYLSMDGSGNLIDTTGRIPVIATENGNVTTYDVLAPSGTINNQGTRVRYTVTTTPMIVSSDFQAWADSDIHQWCDWCPDKHDTSLFAPVTSIQLADGSNYSFGYDGTGELTSVTLPTGGVITYGYNDIFDSSNTENRWLVSRTVGSDPATTFTPSVLASCANYSNGCKEQVTVHKPSGDETVYELTLNNGAWNTGTTVYDGPSASGKKLLQTTSFNTYTNGCDNKTICSGANYLSQTLTTTARFASPATSAVYAQTQSFFNSSVGKISDVKEWDYVSTSPSTTTAPTSTPTRETVYTYTGSDPFQVKVLDSGANQAGLTTYGYTTTATATSNVTRHGSQNAGGPYLQSVTHWLSTGGGDSTTSYTMYDTGQVYSLADANGNPPTTFTYQCGGSLPLIVTNPLNQTTQYGFDCPSGSPTSVQDANDLAAQPQRSGTTYTYESQAGRLQTTTRPDGGTTTYSYPSAAEVDTAISASPSPTVSSSQLVDSYGRSYRQVSPNGASEASYDQNGRPYCTTNPHPIGAASTGSVCITSYDGLDRPLAQLQADGSSANWSYSANVTNSSNEAGHTWARTMNALGQLTSVVEPGGLQTNYVYDGLGNPKTVSQQGIAGSDLPRPRSFFYDSMSRVITAQSPELGLICYGVWSGTNCINGYDLNGNLVNKTDARGVTVTYKYDALNRLTHKTYSGPGSAISLTPAVQYDYDQSASWNGIPRQNTIGRLWHEASGAGTSKWNERIYSYDAVGRVAQILDAPPTQAGTTFSTTTGSYDLAGNLHSLTYPDGRIVSHGFDAAGNLTSVDYSNWNGTPMSQNYFNAGQGAYDAAGHLVSGSFGNAVAIGAAYDNRERLQSLSYGPSSAPRWSKQYAWTLNSNLQSATDLITGVQRQFGYDSLNRLTAAQDIFSNLAVPSGSNGNTGSTSNSGSGAISTSGTAGAVPWWTNPDDSNLLPDLNDPNSGWGVYQATLSRNYAMAPDGTMTAASVARTPATSYINGPVASPASYSLETMTGSVWLRSVSGTSTLSVYLTESFADGTYAIAGWQTFTLTPTWQQFHVTGALQAKVTGLNLQIGAVNDANNTAQSFLIWNPMLEDEGISGSSVTNFLPYSQQLGRVHAI